MFAVTLITRRQLDLMPPWGQGIGVIPKSCIRSGFQLDPLISRRLYVDQ
jgi:hypothetical protein